MWEYLPLALVVGLIALWVVGVYAANRRRLLEPRHLHPAGPFLMWKTVRGRAFIEWLSRPKRFWRIFGDASLAIVGLTMIGTTALLIWEATIVQTPAVRENAPSPQLLLGLPGINPLIPLWYGIFGLAVAIVLHEFSHGILARVANIKIRSLGVIFFILPIGAFVEPDEDEMKALPRRERARLYAVGPATNMILALVFAFLFSAVMMFSVTPVHDGVGIVSFTSDSPIQAAGATPFTVITNVNGTEIRSYADFTRVKATLHANDTILITTYDGSQYRTFNVTLASDVSGGPLFGFFGVDTTTDYYHPLSNPSRFGGISGAILVYIALPFTGYAPIDSPQVEFYRITGPLSAIPAPLFWILANTMYWLFWLNVMLGATNSLPAVPLDGGYIFRDALEGFVTRLRRGIGAEARDKIVRQISYTSALFILALILWQLIGPRI